MFFALTCLTAPTLGVVLGGIVLHHYGGYQSPKALKISSIVSLLAMASALPVPFIDDNRIFQSLIWLLLFFGGFIVPVVTGILLTSVRPNERTIANSFANLSYNLIGYLPSPFIYGFICTLTGGDQSRYGIGILMFASIPACFFLFLALQHKNS